ncbi:MAG TPA: hypothetical protein VH917_00320, partial [Ignavibacteriaceae bacterium]
MIILKFGGTSVGNSNRIKSVASILKKRFGKSGKAIVVVSAFAGVTDDLIKVSKAAAKGDVNFRKLSDQINERHLNVINSLIPLKKRKSVLSEFKVTLNELDEVLHGVFLVKELSARTLDFVMSFGERLSAFIISNYLSSTGSKAEFVDTRKLIITDDSFGNAKVDFVLSNKKIKKAFANSRGLKIV